MELVHRRISDHCTRNPAKCIRRRQRFTDRCLQMLFACRALLESCKISCAPARVEVSVARRCCTKFDLLAMASLVKICRIVPSSSRSLIRSNFHLATLPSLSSLCLSIYSPSFSPFLSSRANIYGGLPRRRRDRQPTSRRNVPPRIRVPCSRRFHGSKMKEKRKDQRPRAGKKLRSQTVTETFSASRP